MGEERPLDPTTLMRLAEDRNTESRSRLAETLTGLFVDDARPLNDRERALMAEILHRILRDTEVAVRRRIGAVLARRGDVPHDLISFLANDRIEVAYPVLRHSHILDDNDLLEIIRSRTFEHRLTISIRDEVSSEVSDALVATGSEPVICSLLRNPDAELSEATLAYLVEQSRRLNALQEPILHREDLPEELARKMLVWVSAALRGYIVDRFQVPGDSVDDLMSHAVLADDAPVRPPSMASRLADYLDQRGKATPQFLIAVLREGEVRLFISVLAHMSELSESLVQRFLYEPGNEALAVVCRALDVPRSDFSTIFSLIHAAQPDHRRTYARDLGQVLSYFDSLTLPRARQLLGRWQSHQDYMAAVMDLEEHPENS